MSQLLKNLLQANHKILDDSISKLEDASGNIGRDVRLTAEVVGKTHIATKSLGLDPHDSDAREVYAALNDLASKHDKFMRQQLGLEADTSTDEVITRVHAFINKLHIPRSVWVLKHSVAKKLLKKIPPKRTKKALGYRSLDSMLKREPLPHILGAALHLESDAWVRKFREQYEDISQHDFEQRRIDVHLPSSRHWQDAGIAIASRLQTNVIDVKELGAILLLPLPKKDLPGISLALVILLLAHIEELRMYSSLFKLHQMKDDFGRNISTVLRNKSKLQHKVIDSSIDWKIVHAYFGAVDDADHPELFKPHITVEDLAWRRTEEILLSIEPAFDFWKGNEYVGAFFKGSDAPVSFSLMDAVLNLANQVPFEKRLIHSMQAALWDEILLRYMESNFVRSRVLSQLGHNNQLSLQNAMDNEAFTLI